MIEQEDERCVVSLSNEALAGLKSIAEQISLSVSELLEQLGKGHLAVVSPNKLVVAQTEFTTSNQTWQDPDPYDWGTDEPPKGKPIQYIPGVGAVVIGGKDAST